MEYQATLWTWSNQITGIKQFGWLKSIYYWICPAFGIKFYKIPASNESIHEYTVSTPFGGTAGVVQVQV